MPDLVVYDDQGKPFTVKYHMLSSMLLNELKQTNERFKTELAAQAAAHGSEMQDLRSRLEAIESRGAFAESRAGASSDGR